MPGGIPLATYRLQLTSQFTFDDAGAVVPYLKRLGVSHIYASPFMMSRHGSTHGYDVVDPNRINPELGGEEGFERFSSTLKAHDLGLILDFVPNHMGVHGTENPWWLDVLEWGPRSPYAASFDIDWDTLPFRTRPGLLLPILGSSYGECLAKGEIELRYDPADGSFSAWYFEHRLPIAPDRYGDILRTVAGSPATTADQREALLAIVARDAGRRAPDRAAFLRLKQRLRDIAGASDSFARGLEAYRAGTDRPTQTQALHNLLERQHYRLAHWRLATSDINYRRFFDVNSLAGLRVEDRPTFDRLHERVRRLIADGKLQGLRLDHIDGLRDPAQYFQRLRRLIHDARGARREPFYLVIEKILGEHEALPHFAGVHGTTGYEWLNTITRVLADGRGLPDLDETWRQASNTSPEFEPVLLSAKRRVLETLLASEFTVLIRLLARIAAGHYSTRDYSEDSLRQAFELFVLHFPVYRTYITAAGPNPRDRAIITETIACARRDWFAADDGIFDFLRDALTLDLLAPGRPPHSRPRVQRFAFKVQQFTGPMMAKSLEDTAFYRYHRLLAFNEVGGDPAATAIGVDHFHAEMTARAQDWPHGLTATATHDTKRGEDARTRIVALTELPGEWTSVVGRWKTFNAGAVSTTDGVRSPSLADEYMLYQALLGALPMDGIDDDFTGRVQEFAAKAIREAKLQTSWLNPNPAYEAGVRDFVAAILDSQRSQDFIGSLSAFTQRIALLGALNSLSQITLKMTMLGVPDLYQGTEFWDLSFVDPDNRRPVDFARRAEMLDETPDWNALAARWPDGRLKLAWTRRLLAFRNRHAAVFTHGDYAPLAVRGRHRDHVIAFARRHRGAVAIVVTLRHFRPFTDGGTRWPDWKEFDAAVDLGGMSTERDIAEGRWLVLNRSLQTIPALVISGTAAKHTKKPH